MGLIELIDLGDPAVALLYQGLCRRGMPHGAAVLTVYMILLNDCR